MEKVWGIICSLDQPSLQKLMFPPFFLFGDFGGSTRFGGSQIYPSRTDFCSSIGSVQQGSMVHLPVTAVLP
eukprot:3269189-Amphidinium_carterae.1